MGAYIDTSTCLISCFIGDILPKPPKGCLQVSPKLGQLEPVAPQTQLRLEARALERGEKLAPDYRCLYISTEYAVGMLMCGR